MNRPYTRRTVADLLTLSLHGRLVWIALACAETPCTSLGPTAISASLRPLQSLAASQSTLTLVASSRVQRAHAGDAKHRFTNSNAEKASKSGPANSRASDRG